MYRLLLFITSLLISFAGFAQTPSDSIQEARKVKIEKARAAARAKAEAKAAERAKMEAEKNANKTNEAKDKIDNTVKSDSQNDLKSSEKGKEEKIKRDRKSREDKKKEADASSKTASPDDNATKKEEKVKKPSIKERNKADTTVARSKYGDGTFGWRGNIGATIAWSNYSGREDKIGFESWGFVLNGGMGYRFNHIAYAGLLIDIEAIELLAFSPMIDFVVAAPTPVSPFVELTAGPYVSYDENRSWVFQPRAGLSYRGKKNKIMRFGFGLRMYDDAFKSNSGSFKPQYAASYTVEF